MPLKDWIDHYPQVKALLQTEGESLDYAPDVGEMASTPFEPSRMMWDFQRYLRAYGASCHTVRVLRTETEHDAPHRKIDTAAIIRRYEDAIARSLMDEAWLGHGSEEEREC